MKQLSANRTGQFHLSNKVSLKKSLNSYSQAKKKVNLFSYKEKHWGKVLRENCILCLKSAILIKMIILVLEIVLAWLKKEITLNVVISGEQESTGIEKALVSLQRSFFNIEQSITSVSEEYT